MHDVNILRIQADADVGALGAVIRRLDEPLEALEIDNGVIVDTLEGDGGDGAAQMTCIRADNVNILRTDDDIDRLVLLKALVHAGKDSAEEFDLVVLEHDAVENVRFTDKVGNKFAVGVIVDLLRRTHLSDNTLVHNNDVLNMLKENNIQCDYSHTHVEVLTKMASELKMPDDKEKITILLQQGLFLEPKNVELQNKLKALK